MPPPPPHPPTIPHINKYPRYTKCHFRFIFICRHRSTGLCVGIVRFRRTRTRQGVRCQDADAAKSELIRHFRTDSLLEARVLSPVNVPTHVNEPTSIVLDRLRITSPSQSSIQSGTIFTCRLTHLKGFISIAVVSTRYDVRTFTEINHCDDRVVFNVPYDGLFAVGTDSRAPAIVDCFVHGNRWWRSGFYAVGSSFPFRTIRR